MCRHKLINKEETNVRCHQDTCDCSEPVVQVLMGQQHKQSQSELKFTQRHVGDSKVKWKNIRGCLRKSFVGIRLDAVFGRHQTPHTSANTPPHREAS